MKHLGLIVLVFLNLRVFSQDKLTDHPVLSQYYTQGDIERLGIIVDFFDHYVQRQTGTTDWQETYDTFNKSAAQEEQIMLDIPLDSLHAMYAEVNLPVWNSIWDYTSVGTR